MRDHENKTRRRIMFAMSWFGLLFSADANEDEAPGVVLRSTRTNAVGAIPINMFEALSQEPDANRKVVTVGVVSEVVLNNNHCYGIFVDLFAARNHITLNALEINPPPAFEAEVSKFNGKICVCTGFIVKRKRQWGFLEFANNFELISMHTFPSTE